MVFARLSRVFALASSLLVCAVALGAEPLAIFDSKSTPTESIVSRGVELSRLDDGALRVVNGRDDRWPGAHFKGNWNLDGFAALEITIRSTSERPVSLFCRVDCEKSNAATLEGTLSEQTTLEPNERKTWRVNLTDRIDPETKARLFGMRGIPGGIKIDPEKNSSGAYFDKSSVVEVMLFEVQNNRDDSWILESLVAVSDENATNDEDYLSWGPEKFFPMIDEFGQFKHADWPGKTHSLDELRAQIAKEESDLAAHQPTGLDEYGGWLGGPQLEATGAFRTEKIDGYWCLVDPAGRLFWSHGIDGVGANHSCTPITWREEYFDPSTPREPDGSEFAQFLHSGEGAAHNYVQGRGKYWRFSFSEANLYRKYGPDWVEKNKETVVRRLRSWGLNTIAVWCDLQIAVGSKTPYIGWAHTGGRVIEGSEGYWGRFRDPFDPGFAQSVRQTLGLIKEQTADDPYCIGYFVDNELGWGEVGSLALAALESPKDQPAKVAFIEWLRAKYEKIERLNESWGTSFPTWNALADKPFDGTYVAGVKKDADAFYAIICERYFSEVARAIRELAPKKLYLGCRFSGAKLNDVVKTLAQKYCDVVGYNIYDRGVDALSAAADGIDKPFIIGEFHFGALDRGMFHTGLVPCESQDERAKAYRRFVEEALRDPRIVGTHWFMYGDEPTTGESNNGENYQIGFVDVCDVPYAETIEAARQVGYSLYETRDEARKASSAQ